MMEMADQDMYTVQVNGMAFTIGRENAMNADLVPVADGHYHLIAENRSVDIHVIRIDLQKREMELGLAGGLFMVRIADSLDRLLETMGMQREKVKSAGDIRAPMPGLVLEVKVTEGVALEAGDTVLVLEAMKMENSIRLQSPATIKKICVSKGQAVEKGQVLVELE